MKSRISIYRKIFAITYLLYVSIIICGCEETDKQNENINSSKIINVHWFDSNGYKSKEQFVVINIDSCEYLLAGFAKNRIITHKGNCRFCAIRSKN